MEDKIISVLNNVRTNLSNELETKTKELVKPFDDFADRLSAVEVAPLKIRGLSIEEIDNNFENISVEILEKLENGNRKVKFEYDGIFNEILDQIGLMPLPPYIHEKLKERIN